MQNKIIKPDGMIAAQHRAEILCYNGEQHKQKIIVWFQIAQETNKQECRAGGHGIIIDGNRGIPTKGEKVSNGIHNEPKEGK